MGYADNDIMQRTVFKDKSILASLILATITVFSLPLLLPHITHESMIYHITLHLVTLLISILLVIVASVSYYRNRSRRLLLTMLAIVALSIIEGINFLTSVGAIQYVVIQSINIEITHILLLFTLVFLLSGILKR